MPEHILNLTDARLTTIDKQVFSIALKHAASSNERESLKELIDLRQAVNMRQVEAVDEFNANRRARAEEVRTPNAAEQSELDDLSSDSPLNDESLAYLEQLPNAALVLRTFAFPAEYGYLLSRESLQYINPEDRYINEKIISAEKAFLDRLYSFINDRDFQIETEREAATLILSGASGSSAIFVVLSEEIPLQIETMGYSLSRHYRRLDGIAQELGVTPLGEFIGIAGRESQDWFDPATGLATVSAIMEHISPGQFRIKGKKDLKQDLQDVVDVLSAAQNVGAKFHLEVDV